MKTRDITLVIAFTLLIIQIIIFPNDCIEYTLAGTKIFINSVFPSLFPFVIITNLLIGFNGVNIYSNTLGKFICYPLKLTKECSLPLIISMLCGYPLGAKYSCILYENKIIDSKQCKRLLNIASNPSPLFVIGVIGVSLLDNVYMGYLILASSYISCIIISFFIPSESNKYFIKTNYNYPTVKNIGLIIKESIENAIITIINIGGFIIFFFIITNIIKNNALFSIVFNNIFIQTIILGLIEVTNGCLVAIHFNENLNLSIVLISFFVSFSGLSIITQVYSIIYKYNFSILFYIKYKLIQGVISAITSYILFFVYEKICITYTFNKIQTSNFASNLLILLWLSLTFPFLIYLTKKLFNIS